MLQHVLVLYPIPKNQKDSFKIPNVQALCQPLEYTQDVSEHPPLQCRVVKWEVLSNARYPGMLGACCFVKEKVSRTMLKSLKRSTLAE